MNKRAQLVQAIQNAGTFNEQARAVIALDDYDRMRREAVAQQNSWDAAGTVVERTLNPVAVHERHTAATDWLGDVDTSGGSYHQAMCAEASVWFQGVDPMVRADREEFSEQAKGMARRTAGKYGEQADAACQTFLDYVAFLHSQAASGLPQVDQERNPKDDPEPTPLPTETFDTFEGPVHPVNVPVEGEGGQPQNGAPLIDEIEQYGAPYGNGPEKPGGHSTQMDESGSYAEVPLGPPGQIPTTGSLSPVDPPSVAIAYGGRTLDDYRQEFAREAARNGNGRRLDPTQALRKGAPFAGYEDFAACVRANQDKDDPEAYCGSIKHKVEDGKKEGASTLPVQHQTVDPNNNPTPQADQFNTEVMFPLVDGFQNQESTEDLPAAENVAQAKRREFVASLLQRSPSTWSNVERAEVADYLSKAAGLSKQADQWSAPHNVPGGETPVSNSVDTADQPASGSYGKGMADGQADRASGDRPTFSDASSHASDYVRGYTQGYAGGSDPTIGQPDVPYSLGGDTGQSQNAQDAQNAAQVAMASGNGQSRGSGRAGMGRVVASSPSKSSKKNRGSVLRVSAALVDADVTGSPDFVKGYNFAKKWTAGKRLVSLGSVEFEQGLYAGITDNPKAQASWVAEHRRLARKHRQPELIRRISVHERVTRRHARKNPEALVKGFYVQAATSTDLITTGPGTSPDPMGGTPINGPGTPPPMEGGIDPARPGGPSPYNGAEPFGAGPVAPDPVVGPQQSDQSEMPSPEQRQAAFRAVIKANLTQMQQEAS